MDEKAWDISVKKHEILFPDFSLSRAYLHIKKLSEEEKNILIQTYLEKTSDEISNDYNVVVYDNQLST